MNLKIQSGGQLGTMGTMWQRIWDYIMPQLKAIQIAPGVMAHCYSPFWAPWT